MSLERLNCYVAKQNIVTDSAYKSYYVSDNSVYLRIFIINTVFQYIFDKLIFS